MKIKITLLILLLTAGLLGCAKQPEFRHIVILIDVSGSIDRSALEEAFKAIDELVSHLQRGDRVAIIPILGDAEAEASGRILRFDMPTNRQAYDSDLRRFRIKLTRSLADLKFTATAHPGAMTDILGSIALAKEEFESGGGHSNRLLVILTDLIQEAQNVNFRTDLRLTNCAHAKAFANYLAGRKSIDFKDLQVYLGLLRSKEYAVLSQERKESINEFWMRYFKSFGASPRFVTDGAGLLETTILRQIRQDN